MIEILLFLLVLCAFVGVGMLAFFQYPTWKHQKRMEKSDKKHKMMLMIQDEINLHLPNNAPHPVYGRPRCRHAGTTIYEEKESVWERWLSALAPHLSTLGNIFLRLAEKYYEENLMNHPVAKEAAEQGKQAYQEAVAQDAKDAQVREAARTARVGKRGPRQPNLWDNDDMIKALVNARIKVKIKWSADQYEDSGLITYFDEDSILFLNSIGGTIRISREDITDIVPNTVDLQEAINKEAEAVNSRGVSGGISVSIKDAQNAGFRDGLIGHRPHGAVDMDYVRERHMENLRANSEPYEEAQEWKPGDGDVRLGTYGLIFDARLSVILEPDDADKIFLHVSAGSQTFGVQDQGLVGNPKQSKEAHELINRKRNKGLTIDEATGLEPFYLMDQMPLIIRVNDTRAKEKKTPILFILRGKAPKPEPKEADWVKLNIG